MKFWTILLITYGAGTFDGEVSAIPFPDEQRCGDAIEPLYDLLYEQFPDLMIQCIQTDVASSMTRPKPRPKDLMGPAL